MSEADVEIVRRGFDAFNCGDLDAAIELLDEVAEWVPYLGSLDAKMYRGSAEIKAYLQEISEHLEGFRAAPQEFIDLGDGRVVVRIVASGAGSGSGAGVETRWLQLWTVKGDRIARVDASPDSQAEFEELAKAAEQ